MVARFDDLIITVETGVVRERGREGEGERTGETEGCVQVLAALISM